MERAAGAGRGRRRAPLRELDRGGRRRFVGGAPGHRRRTAAAGRYEGSRPSDRRRPHLPDDRRRGAVPRRATPASCCGGGATRRTRTRRPASPPAVAGAQLVFGTRDGVLFGPTSTPGMTTWAYDVGEPIASQPTVAHGWVYASTDAGQPGRARGRRPVLDGWHMWGGNARHAGPVATVAGRHGAGRSDDERPSRGRSLRLARRRPSDGRARAASRSERTR